MRLEFLPPYSPDFNPIEEGFSAMKNWVRNNGTSVRRALSKPDLQPSEVILTTAVFCSMTTDKIHGWFRHSGYL